MFGKIANFAGDLIFPIHCAECGKEGEWWCEDCLPGESIKPFNFESAGTFLKKLTVFFDYQENSPIGKLIRQYKYNYARDIERVWKRIFAVGARYIVTEQSSDAAIIAVPLYPKRERERGYNQAGRLAKILAEETGLRLLNGGLLRIRSTNQQAKLSREERLKNVRGAFKWVLDEKVPDSVILVDDVYTTGATMGECARVLLKNGAKKTYGLVLARD